MSDELKPEDQNSPEETQLNSLAAEQAENEAAARPEEPVPGGDILNLDSPAAPEVPAGEIQPDQPGESLLVQPGESSGLRRAPDRLELAPATGRLSDQKNGGGKNGGPKAGRKNAAGGLGGAGGAAGIGGTGGAAGIGGLAGTGGSGNSANSSGSAPYGCTAQPLAQAGAGTTLCCPAAPLLQEMLGQRKGWIRRHPFIFFLLLLFSMFILINIIGVIAAYVTKQGPFAENRLAVVRVEGMILDSAPVLKWCRSLEEDDSVRGVLLFVNSPGGAVVPSQELYSGIKRLADKKPMIAYMSSAAASGGYYAAMAAPHIVASPSSLTGSIGVRMELTEMKDMFDWLGIHSQGLASGPYKEAGTPFRPLREDERAYLSGIVQDMHDCFVQDVAAARKLPLDQVRALADGRAYTGRQALGLKLVDQLGDANLAWSELKKRCGMEEEPGEYLDGPPREASWLRDLLLGSLQTLESLRLESSRPTFGFYY